MDNEEADLVSIRSVYEGADGIVKLTIASGSLFRFRMASSLEHFTRAGLDPENLLEAENTVSASLLSDAVDTYSCEKHARRLIHRAEQYRFGLHRKLARAGWVDRVIVPALDWLEEEETLSDYRYAYSWFRMRLRKRAEGPVSLKSALLKRGVRREALEPALSSIFAEEGRESVSTQVWERLVARHKGHDQAKKAFLALGWKSRDIPKS